MPLLGCTPYVERANRASGSVQAPALKEGLEWLAVSALHSVWSRKTTGGSQGTMAEDGVDGPHVGSRFSRLRRAEPLGSHPSAVAQPSALRSATPCQGLDNIFDVVVRSPWLMACCNLTRMRLEHGGDAVGGFLCACVSKCVAHGRRVRLR